MRWKEKGITRGADVIGEVTREADILHISNEVPFAVDCKDPVPKLSGKLSFCSKDSYLALLEAVGTDVVELTGDHFQDWGEAALEHTLELYQQKGWQYYGGGLNIEEARKPLKLEINGNKIAFLGCNAKPTIYGNATDEKGGNFRCDWDYMTAQVQSLRAEGYLPIVTFQHLEFYQWTAQSQLVADFHKMEQAGAVIVSGSQSHQPHGMEITDNAVLHYGLGNLFFDQFGLAPTPILVSWTGMSSTTAGTWVWRCCRSSLWIILSLTGRRQPRGMVNGSLLSGERVELPAQITHPR